MLRKLCETNRARLAEALRARGDVTRAAVLMKGHRPAHELDADTTHAHMHCEANFTYLFGAQQYFYDGLLFLGDERAMLLGAFPPGDCGHTRIAEAAAAEHFGVAGIRPVAELPQLLAAAGIERVFLYHGFSGYDGTPSHCFDDSALAQFAGAVDREVLYPALNDTRTVKSEVELEVMERVCLAASRGHEEMMRRCRPGMTEHQLGALFFEAVSRAGGASDWAYWPICCSGADCAVLHYRQNEKPLADGVLALCDLGVKHWGLCSDITTTFPVNGRFTPRQAEIHRLVLGAQLLGIEQVRAGARYADIQAACFRHILGGLAALGLVRGEVEQLFAKDVHFTFMPHSLGHYIGYKTHDVGLQATAEELAASEERALRDVAEKHVREPGEGEAAAAARLEAALAAKQKELDDRRPRRRTAYQPVTRATLRAGMVLTVEPGIYFIPGLLKKAQDSPELAGFYDFERIEAYRQEVGGVRIEDCVAVEEAGARVLSCIPKTVEDIEALMARAPEKRDTPAASPAAGLG